MNEILCRSAERPFTQSVRSDVLRREDPDLDLRMRENQSHLSEPARQTFAVPGMAMMALTILPALSGHGLAPVFCLMTMGGLVFALEHRARAKPDGEVPQRGGDYTIDHAASVCPMRADGQFQTPRDHDESDDASRAKLRQLLR